MKVKMIHTISAAYDHNHTRLYEQGDVYEVDKQDMVLMPSWLADALLIAAITKQNQLCIRPIAASPTL